MSQNYLPHSLKLEYCMKKLLKNIALEIWVRLRAPETTLFGLGQQSAHFRQKKYFPLKN